jgi:hypothetical protein
MTICHLSSVICHAKTGYRLFGTCRALDLLDPRASFPVFVAPVAQLDRVYDFGSIPESYGCREKPNFCSIFFDAPLAQLDRATVFGTVGCRFEPCRVHSTSVWPTCSAAVHSKSFCATASYCGPPPLTFTFLASYLVYTQAGHSSKDSTTSSSRMPRPWHIIWHCSRCRSVTKSTWYPHSNPGETRTPRPQIRGQGPHVAVV